MEKSKVYFTSMKVNAGTNLLKKLNHLIKEAGIANIDFENKYTAIKIHFGEPGNLAYLRPNYAKVVVDLVKELGGRPFLTDCNTPKFFPQTIPFRKAAMREQNLPQLHSLPRRR